jgi:hypothetical protein
MPNTAPAVSPTISTSSSLQHNKPSIQALSKPQITTIAKQQHQLTLPGAGANKESLEDIECPQFVDFTRNETFDMNDGADIFFGEKRIKNLSISNMNFNIYFIIFLKKDVKWAKEMIWECLEKILRIHHLLVILVLSKSRLFCQVKNQLYRNLFL